MTKYFKNEFAINGDKVDIPNDMQASGEVSYQTGFGIDYQRKLGADVLAKPFPRQGFNGLIADLTGAVKQYQEQGFFDYITPEMNGGEAFSYTMGATVRYDMSDAQDGSDIRVFTSLINNNSGNPKSNPDNWREQGKAQTGGYGFAFTTVSLSTVLREDQAGIILIDASASDVMVTLPATKLNIGFILRRIDNTTNTVKIHVSGADKIKYNLAINANGYSFFSLFGAGDYWRVVSDGVGNWFDIERKDNTTIGAVSFFTTTVVPVGGYLVTNGTLLSRADFPYLWDFAQRSGVLVSEENKKGFEGCFTSGDGSTTFRIPDLRGDFLRGLDNGRGVDADRVAGGYQDDAMQRMVGEASFAQSSGLSIAQEGVFQNGTRATVHVGSNSWNYINNASLKFDNSINTRTADETRPKNVAYPTYIKII